jgi:hypothetical protein
VNMSAIISSRIIRNLLFMISRTKWKWVSRREWRGLIGADGGPGPFRSVPLRQRRVLKDSTRARAYRCRRIVMELSVIESARWQSKQ